jgi:periplasmic divalent cation tolerance protein
MTRHLAVTTTVPTSSEAALMAHALVERKLAACAHIVQIESVFAWQGSVHNRQEFQVLFKTTSERYPAVEQAIRDMHSYELPAIHAVGFDHISEPYAAWIETNSSGQ